MSTSGNLHEIPYIETNYGCIFIGGTISFALYGIACSQAAFYFRTYTNDSKRYKLFVCCALLLETLQCAMLGPALWHYLIDRGVDSPSFFHFIVCVDWSAVGNGTMIELTCILVECFFIMRLWQFKPTRKIAVITFVPAFTGWTFNAVYIAEIWRKRCYTKMGSVYYLIYTSYGLRILSDGIVSGSMCYFLYIGRPESEYINRTVRLLRSLIIWAVTTGVLKWLTSLVFVITNITVKTARLLPVGIYLIRGRVYSNTMLALINHREAQRNMATASLTMIRNISNATRRSSVSRPGGVPEDDAPPADDIPMTTFSISVRPISRTLSSHDFSSIPPVIHTAAEGSQRGKAFPGLQKRNFSASSIGEEC